MKHKEKLFSSTTNNHLTLLLDGPDYGEQFIQAIQTATISIHLQTYIFEIDAFGLRVFDALIEAAKRGVLIYILVDSIGSNHFPQKCIDHLRQNHVYFAFFNHVQWRWVYQWGRRLHHKILIIDRTLAFVGGINIHHSYEKNYLFPRLDFAVSIEGEMITPLIQYCESLFLKNWYSLRSHIQFPSYPTPPISAKITYPSRFLVNDWIYGRKEIGEKYLEMIRQAQENIYIINSYFFPRRKLMKELLKAAKRGVHLYLILPAFSDWSSYIYASEFLYSYLNHPNITIYRWHKSILHGKMATIDNHLTTIGSFNLNYTSFQFNLEMNIQVDSLDFTKNVNGTIHQLIHTGCDVVDQQQFHLSSSWVRKIKRLFYYLTFSFFANFSVGLSIQDLKQNKKFFIQLLFLILTLFCLILGFVGSLYQHPIGLIILALSLMIVYYRLVNNNTKS